MLLASKNKRAFLEKKAGFLQRIRSFFQARHVLEITTPLLNTAGITDPNVHTLSATYQVPGSPARTMYLQTSPEFAMKRLLADGSGDIFQICPAFRNDIFDRWHFPEFTILEWYRVGWDHHALMQEVENLFCDILSCRVVEKITYCDAFLRFANFHPLEISLTTLHEIVLEQTNMHRVENLSRDECLDALMGYVIEPALPKNQLTFLYDYPASQAALAKLNSEDPRVASRFEAYFQGVELANGFHELTDADEQLRRFEKETEIRRLRKLPEIPIDYAFIDALKNLPECAGVAVGVDRLIALAMGLSELDADYVKLFGF